MSFPQSLSAAKKMTKLYRQNKESILEPKAREKGVLPICETFDANDIQKILNQPGCSKLRIYFGMDETLKVHLIIVGVNEENWDILPTESTVENEATGQLPTLDVTLGSMRNDTDLTDDLF